MKIRYSLNLIISAILLVTHSFTALGNTERTRELIQVLQSSSASVSQKAIACRELGEVGTKEAVPALASLLDHELLSAYARAGLERIPDPFAIVALQEALRTVQGKFLVGVINSLSALRDEESVTTLSRLTKHADLKVAKASLNALGRISNDEAIEVVRKALAQGRSPFRSTAAAACLLAAEKQLKAGNKEVARTLYDEVRSAEVPDSYRIGATRGAILARAADPIPFLIEQLHSKEPAIRNVALLTIRDIPSDALANALHGELSSSDPDYQIQLIQAIQELQSDYASVRMAALTVMSEIGGASAVPDYIRVLKEHRTVEEVELSKEQLLGTPDDEVDRMVLIALSGSGDSTAKIHLIELLGKRKVSSAVDELLRQAADSETEVSIEAFRSLEILATMEHYSQLISLNKSAENPSIRKAAEASILSVARKVESKGLPYKFLPGVLLLSELKKSEVSTLRNSWVTILTSLGFPNALPVIMEGLSTDDSEVAVETIRHLGRWPNPAPIPDLLEIVESTSDEVLRKRAVAAIVQLATVAADKQQSSTDQLVSWLQRVNNFTKSVQEKRRIISTLGRVSHIRSLQLLSVYLDDPEVNKEAAYAVISTVQGMKKGRNSVEIEVALEKIEAFNDKGLLEQVTALKQTFRTR